MTYGEIEAFLAVAELGTVSEAAVRLFVSQSTLSGRLRTLEAELGMRLLERGRGVRSTDLTDAGRQFLPVAEQWKRLWQETAALRSGGQHRELRLAAVHSVNAYILPEVYRRFAAAHSSVRLWLQISHSTESYHLVEGGTVETALVARPHYSSKVRNLPLWRESMVFLCGMNSRHGETVRPSELDPGREVLVDWCEDFLTWHDYWFGSEHASWLFSDDVELLEEFLGEGDSWAVVPLTVANGLRCRNRLRRCALESGPGGRTVYLLERGRTQRSPEAHALLELLHTAVMEQGALWLEK